MDIKAESKIIEESTGNSDNSGITSNNEDIQHENIEETTISVQLHEEPPLSIISNTTQQVSELPIISTNLNITAASKITSGAAVPMSTIGSNVAAHHKSDSRHLRTYSDVDTMKLANRPREPRRSAPVPFRPTTEFDVQKKPRPISNIILPTSMKGTGSIISPNSEQEIHTKILNWPTQNYDDKLQSQKTFVGLKAKDNLVDDGEIIFDTTPSDQIGDIPQPSSSLAQQSIFYIPQGRLSMTAAMHKVTNPSRAPEVPPLIPITYGTEIFDQIQSDDDPRLIVWSISRAEERKQGSTVSSVTNVSSSKRWSIHGTLGRAGKTICGAGLKDKKDYRFEQKPSGNRKSNPTTEKVIMAATIEKLIEKLTSGIDYTFLTDFFLTYRTFITPLQLCNLLILRFDWALEDNNEQRRVVRVRTFVTLRHWLLNYFAYDFVPCRALRSKLISYLNYLPSHPLVQNSPHDQRIVHGLKRVIRRLKRIYYRKGIMGILKSGTGRKSIKELKEMAEANDSTNKGQHQHSEQYLDDDVISSEHSGTGVDTNTTLPSKDKSRKMIVRGSTSTLGSILTPGTTDSEGEEFDTLGHHFSSRSRISRPAVSRQSFEFSSSNSQHSDDDYSLKRTYENPISIFYNEKWARSLPTVTSEIDSNWEQGVNIEKVHEFDLPIKQREEIVNVKKKLRSSSMNDLSQERKGFNNTWEHNLRDDDVIVEEEEPPPLPPRKPRRHTITSAQPIPTIQPPPSFFKGGFFPTRKPKKVVSQETMSEKFQDRTRKKRSLSLSEAIFARRNSSPAYIESPSLRSDQQEKGETSRRRISGRPSWPQKMSATMGKFAKVLFSEKNKIPGTSGSIPGRTGVIKMFCANPTEVDTMDGSDDSVPIENLNNFTEEDFPIHVDGFSYVDESLEEEFYDTHRQEDFAAAETNLPPIPSTSFQEQESSDNDKNLEGQENRHNRSTRRNLKMWSLGPVLEVDDDEETSISQISPLDASLVSELRKEEEEMATSSETKKTEDPQSARKRRRLAKVFEVEEESGGETNFVKPLPSEPSGDEMDIDIEEEEGEHDHSSHRLRRLPKVRDLRSVVTLKDIEEKSGKRISWSTFSSLGTLGINDTSTEAKLSYTLTPSSSKLNRKESVKSSVFETQGEKGKSKEVERESFKGKDKSIIKPSSSRPVSKSSNVTPRSPRKSSESSVKRIVITEPSSKKLTGQHDITTEPSSSSSQAPIKNLFYTRTSLDKPLPPLPFSDDQSRKPPSISSTLNSQSPYRSFILNYRSEVIAKQFCLIERDLLLKVNWEELVQVGYTSNDKDTESVQELEEEQEFLKGEPRKRVRDNGVDKVIERFNLSCDWVATEIVLTRSMEDRIRVIEKFIRIAQKCLQFSNFATLTQILLGLQSSPVERLRRTWTRIRKEDLRILKELNEYISPFGNWKVIREAMRQSIEDATILKALIKQGKRRGSDVRKINTGCIPFLGLYLSDLVFNAAVPSFIDPPSQPPTPSSPSFNVPSSPLYHQQPLINFHKHRTTATIIKRILTFQNLSREYSFYVDKEIYDKCFGLKGFEATKLVVMDLDVDDFV
ncbi:3669_t:CDS:10 [Funneliformis caledonium]|uniref:3669_t:CDS:1 n=1 Tax=Funneliformis caledonium TaxID=1117310 RepID=A0A9N8WG97_9GLOM|nr:3669_t:CDS:10 [Funneliformis caledonium]